MQKNQHDKLIDTLPFLLSQKVFYGITLIKKSTFDGHRRPLILSFSIGKFQSFLMAIQVEKAEKVLVVWIISLPLR